MQYALLCKPYAILTPTQNIVKTRECRIVQLTPTNIENKLSQWKEMIEDPINKIGRPRQLYTGYKARPYQVESSREKKSIFNWLWKKD
jgi:hypothetical protein